MFDIEYKGGNTVVITTKKVSIVFDPKQSLIGLKDLVVKDAIEVVTEERFQVVDKAYRLLLDSPGEYEIADVSVRGIAASRHIDDSSVSPAATVYQLEVGGVRMAVLGNIAPKLNDDQLEAIGIVDIVVIPVGGNGYTLDATSATSLVRQLEPKAVIPIHYVDSSLKYEVPQDTLDVFTSELGAPIEQSGNKYKLKAISNLPEVLTTVIVDRS